MDPITLSILASSAGAAAGTLPKLIPTKYEREQKRRLEDLQKKEAAGLLGLTEQQKGLMERQLQGGAQAAAMGAQAERNRLLAGGGGASGGQALLGAQLADEERQRAQERISTEIMAADIQQKQRQEDEIRNLQAAESERREQSVAAAGAILGAGIEGGVNEAAFQKIAAQKKPSEAQVLAYATTFNTTPEMARGILELGATNPEALRYMSVLKGGL